MADHSFFKKNGSFTIKEIIDSCGGDLQDNSKQGILIDDIKSLDSASTGTISFLQNKKYIESFKNTKASACITYPEFADIAPKECTVITSNNPYYLYSLVLKKFYDKEPEPTEIPFESNVAFSAEIGHNTRIAPGAFIGENCIIGDNCIIHPNVTITNSIIGNNVIIHPGAAIGQDGFGYAFEHGKHHKVMQLGRVIIGNDVEIGANTSIDRGSASDTIIGEGTKIDNLVMIAHNVEIGKHCVITSQVGIAGSTQIGDYCVFGGQSGIAGHLKIGNQVQLAAKCGVTKNLEDGSIMGGTPAVPLREYHKQHLTINNLIKSKTKNQKED